MKKLLAYVMTLFNKIVIMDGNMDKCQVCHKYQCVCVKIKI